MQHYLGHTAGEKDLHGGVVLRAVGQNVDEARHRAVNAGPILNRRTAQPHGVGDRRYVQNQIGRTAEGRVNHHRVVDGVVSQDVAGRDALGLEVEQRARRAAGQVAPDFGAGRIQRAVRQGEAEAFGDNLARGRGTHELATAAGRAAGSAAHFRRVLERDLVARETGGEGLHLAGVLGLLGEQRDAARHQHRRQVRRAGEGHEHRGQPFVAGGDAEHAAPRGQRADQPAQHDRGVVPVGEAVEHAGGAVGAAVARIADVAGKGHGAGRRHRAGGFFHEQADLPVSGVVTERDWRAVGGADAALGTEDEKLFTAEQGGIPAHAGVLRQPKEVAAGHVPQLVGFKRQFSAGTGGGGAQGEDGVVSGIENWVHAGES